LIFLKAFSPFYKGENRMDRKIVCGPNRELSLDEIIQLQKVKAHLPLSKSAYLRLELDGLIDKGLDGWILTIDGTARLAFGK
jgi:hypothetical protein